MKIITVKKVLLLFCLMSCIIVNAQSTEKLTNKSIIDLTKAGLGNDLIISKIQTSAANYDVSTNGLIALKKAGISENIIQAMINKGNTSSNTATSNTNTSNSSNSNTTSNNVAPDIESINVVYLFNDNKPVMLERNAAKMHSHTRALGYGGAVTVFEIAGEKSPVRLQKGNNVFVVNTGGGAGDAFVLYKVDIKSGKRQAQAASFSTFGGMKGAKGVLPVDVKMLKTNVYQITPTAPLEKGEYFFANKSAGNSALSSTSADVYAFGVD